VNFKKNVCVIGSDIRDGLFKGIDPIHRTLKIGRSDFRIIGVMEKQGGSFLGGPNFDRQVFIPITSYVRAFGGRRGHVDVNVYYEPAGPASVEVNRGVAEAYMKAVGELQGQFGVKTEPDLIALFRLPGVVAAPGVTSELQSEEAQERLGAQLEACLAQALGRLETMRRSEGQTLTEEMQGLLARIAEQTAEIESLSERVRPAFARRLEAKLSELLSGAQIDPARLAQEAALLAERSDVTEELARLRSHVDQFRKLLAGAGEAGKKLDFLLQEMQREANTLLSKTPGVESEGLAITTFALEVKSDIEKLREQAQNVE